MEKRLCHITLAPGFRGGERQAEVLIRELAGRNRQQRLIVRRGNDLVGRCADIPGLEVIEVASNPIAAALAARGSAIVHAHEARSIYSGLLASLLFDIPYVFTRRVPNPQRPSLLRTLSYRRAAGPVVISKAVLRSVSSMYPDIDFRIVPDAHASLQANASVAARIREERAGKVLIGHVGALVQCHKGQLTIIEAARLVQHEHPDWHFLLCGSGRDEERFRVAAEGLVNIEFVGFVENIGDYYGAFDVFVFPSLQEAIGSAMIDAMYFGLPIVATDVGGIPEFVDDGVNGRLIEVEQPEQLVAGINDLLDNPDWAASVRAANIEKATMLDAVAMADRYEQIYGEILG
jgi:glycosyltransferase involved in cell wall biosynthesis